jgi:hypothetical protein
MIHGQFNHGFGKGKVGVRFFDTPKKVTKVLLAPAKSLNVRIKFVWFLTR